MQDETTRREFMKDAAATPIVLSTADDDGWFGDGGILDGLFGGGDIPEDARVAVGEPGERTEVNSHDIDLYVGSNGTQYIPDGDAGWMKISSTGPNPTFEHAQADTVTSDSVDAGSLNADVLLDNLTQPVGRVGQYTATVNPADYSTDADALQALNDDLVANGPDSETGRIWIPATRPDGTDWTISKTVEFGGGASSLAATDTHTILPRGCGFDRNQAISVTITDGSPAFKIPAPSAGAHKPIDWLGNLAFDLNSNDAEALRMNSVVGCRVVDVATLNGGDTNSGSAAGLVVMSSNCYGLSFEQLYHFSGGTGTDVLVTDDPDASPPGNFEIAGSCVISGTCRTAYSFPVAVGVNTIAGHVEQAAGPAAVYITNSEQANWGFTSGVRFGSNDGSTSTDAIRLNVSASNYLAVSTGCLVSPGRDGVRLESGNISFVIMPFQFNSGSAGGNAITIGSNVNAFRASRIPAGSEMDGSVVENSGDANIVQNSVA